MAERGNTLHIPLARGEILRWQDDNFEYIEVEARREVDELMQVLDLQLEEVSLTKLTYFGKEIVKPLVNQAAEGLVARCREHIVDTFSILPGSEKVVSDNQCFEENESEEDLLDKKEAFLSALGLVGSTAVPVTSFLRLAGLVGASAISWPVVIVGGVTTLAAGTFGAHYMREKFLSGVRERMRDRIRKRFLYDERALAFLLKEDVEKMAQALLQLAGQKGEPC